MPLSTRTSTAGAATAPSASTWRRRRCRRCCLWPPRRFARELGLGLSGLSVGVGAGWGQVGVGGGVGWRWGFGESWWQRSRKTCWEWQVGCPRCPKRSGAASELAWLSLARSAGDGVELVEMARWGGEHRSSGHMMEPPPPEFHRSHRKRSRTRHTTAKGTRPNRALPGVSVVKPGDSLDKTTPSKNANKLQLGGSQPSGSLAF